MVIPVISSASDVSHSGGGARAGTNNAKVRGAGYSLYVDDDVGTAV